MKQNNRRSLGEEVTSSQVYQTLRRSSFPMAGKLAEGIGRAAQELDQVVGEVSAARRQGGHPYQTPSGQGEAWRTPYAQPSKAAKAQRVAAAQRAAAAQHQRPPQAVPQQPQPPTKAAKAQQVAAAQRAAAARYQSPPQAAPQQPHGQQGAARTQPAPQPAPQPPMKLVRTGSPAKFYLTGGAALLYAFAAPLYEPFHFVLFAAVLVGVFLLSGAVFKGKKVWVPVEPEKPPQPAKEEKPQAPASTGDPEVDKLIAEGREYLKKLRAADEAIPEETLSEDITRMEKASADIFRTVAAHPEKAPQIRKFMNYYLPTTLKLLTSYQRLSQQSVKGENVTSTMFNIAGMMHTVADAFEKQLDALYTQEAMDISADITVFETMLKQEGFVEEEKQESP